VNVHIESHDLKKSHFILNTFTEISVYVYPRYSTLGQLHCVLFHISSPFCRFKCIRCVFIFVFNSLKKTGVEFFSLLGYFVSKRLKTSTPEKKCMIKKPSKCKLPAESPHVGATTELLNTDTSDTELDSENTSINNLDPVVAKSANHNASTEYRNPIQDANAMVSNHDPRHLNYPMWMPLSVMIIPSQRIYLMWTLPSFMNVIPS